MRRRVAAVSTQALAHEHQRESGQTATDARGPDIDADRPDQSPIRDRRSRASCFGSGDARPPVPGCRDRGGRSGVARPGQLSPVAARLFDADGHDRRIELANVDVGDLGDRQLLWLDVDRENDDEALSTVADILDLPPTVLDRLSKEPGRANLSRTQERLHLTLETLETEEGDSPLLTRREIHLVGTRNVVLTVHAGRVAALQRFVDTMDGETRLGALHAADLMSSLVDEVILGYFMLAEMIERDIDDLDQRALHGRRADDVLGEIVSVRRRIGLVRRTLTPHRDALASLGRPEMRVEETVGQPWPGLIDRLEGAIAAIDGVRDSLLGTYDIHIGRVAQRANDVMKTLTLLSAVLLPAVVLAGIMGMNFAMPLFEDTSNFFLVLGSMIALAVGILAVARWRDWI